MLWLLLHHGNDLRRSYTLLRRRCIGDLQPSMEGIKTAPKKEGGVLRQRGEFW